ncbi:MAG: hypothetical protein ACTS68_01200 [Candidatus Hodgkinia cicadicola]
MLIVHTAAYNQTPSQCGPLFQVYVTSPHSAAFRSPRSLRPRSLFDSNELTAL